MRLNWYVDTDGTSHRLHTDTGWSDIVVGDIALPADDLVPLGRADARALDAAIRGVERSLGIPDPTSDGLANNADGEVPSLRIHVNATWRDDHQYLMVSGKYGSVAASRAISWRPETPKPQLHALTATHHTPALRGATGPAQLSIGADPEWTATLTVTGDATTTRLPLLREALGTPAFRLIEGPRSVRAIIDREQLRDLLSGAPVEEEVTLAFVPSRLLVRSAAGMLGALDCKTTGDPQQQAFAVQPILAGLDALPASTTRVVVELFGSADELELRLGDTEVLSRCSVLRPGWRYT